MTWTYQADPTVTSLPALARSRMRDGGKVFIRNGDGRNFSFDETWALAGRLAGALRAHGVESGDRVAVQVDKSPEAIILFLACARAGAIFLPLNTAYTLNEVDYFVGDAEPRRDRRRPGEGQRPCRSRRPPPGRGNPVAGDRRRRHADGRGRRAKAGLRRCRHRLGRSRRHPLHLGHDRAIEGRDADPRQPRLERAGADRHLALHRPRRADPRPADLPHPRAVRGDQHAAPSPAARCCSCRSSTPTK